jgi:DNA helicase-2/ATP-dependent DNA helicase PcrA
MVRLRGLWDGEAEARFVGEEIEALQRQGHRLSEVAILVRTSSQTREFEERFITLGLPYRVVGGPRFYERMEIRDALAYLRVINQPDDGLAFERIMNKPKRGLGDATLRLLHGHARVQEISLMQAARELVETDELRAAARRALGDLIADFDRWRGLAEQAHHVELAQVVLDESGYTEMWQNDKTAEAPGRLENLKELVNAMEEFDSLGGFLEHVSLVMEAIEGQGQDQVNLRALEEERRLAYVGLTRARRRAIVSFAANRRLHGSWSAAVPSRFVDELPEEQIERESDPGLYGATAGGFGTSGSQSGSRGGSRGGFGGGFADWGQDRETPGMARARQRAGQANRFIDVIPSRVESLPSGGFGEGERVFHQKFGYGTVRLAEGERLTIAFDKAGEKKVIASFVVPEGQAG